MKEFMQMIRRLKRTKKKKSELLEGLDEYYASRRDLLNENKPHEKTDRNEHSYVVVDNLTVKEWAKQNDASPIEDTFLRR